ncbi:GntR family transcriptional regulator [Georgenia faecalis]|uniref:GntR family transcriptional regulator n=1 Tax=Georgenia faecalis TaxID=2483799 RepID=A0ABV9DA56_9MICO|nr:GntR family transcriptional regulator [Georgenia faecalis]
MSASPAGPAEPTAVAMPAASLPLRIIANDATPLYLQIVLQLKQLILTGELPDGVQLPAVRVLAGHLGVNPGTVMQAYRELAHAGLTASLRGRGSVVRTLSGRSGDVLTRERMLDAAVASLTLRARALGFDAAQTQQRVAAALLSAREPVPVVFLGVNAAHARSYAADLDERFSGADVTFVPHSMADILARDPALRARLDTAYTVLAFASRVPEVERALDDWGVAAEIIGVRAEITERSRRALARVGPDLPYTLVTEKRAVTTILAMLRVEPVEVVAWEEGTPPDDARLLEVARGSHAIVYSFGVRDEVLALPVSPERLLALEFELTESTVRELDKRWGHRTTTALGRVDGGNTQ